MVRIGISIGGRIDLYITRKDISKAKSYTNENLRPHFIFYAVAYFTLLIFFFPRMIVRIQRVLWENMFKAEKIQLME